MKKIADCKVQPYRVRSQENTFRNESQEDTFRKEDNKELNKDEIDDDDDDEKMEGPKTRSRSKSEREAKKDVIGAFWMTKQNSECFDPFTIYVVEVPKKEHGLPKVVEAKEREISNLKDFDTFVEVEDEGQSDLGG